MDSLFGFIISSNFTHGWHRKDMEKCKSPITKVTSIQYIRVIFHISKIINKNRSYLKKKRDLKYKIDLKRHIFKLIQTNVGGVNL